MVTTACAVLELDRGDVADPDAGDAHRLALAGRDGLRGLDISAFSSNGFSSSSGIRSRWFWTMT